MFRRGSISKDTNTIDQQVKQVQYKCFGIQLSKALLRQFDIVPLFRKGARFSQKFYSVLVK